MGYINYTSKNKDDFILIEYDKFMAILTDAFKYHQYAVGDIPSYRDALNEEIEDFLKDYETVKIDIPNFVENEVINNAELKE